MSGLINEIVEALLPEMSFLIAVIFAIGCIQIVIIFTQSAKAKEDDEKAEIVIEATVLSKMIEGSDGFSKFFGINNPIEWIVFESSNGNRVRLRNVKIKEILLSPGDKGILVYRGNTIYQFIKR